VQKSGCEALAVLAAHDQNKVSACIDAIVQGMCAHAGVADVQQVGCKALLSLAIISDESKAAVCQAGGVQAVVHGMSAHLQNWELQCGAFDLIQNFKGSDAGTTAIQNAGAIDAVVKGMQANNYIVNVQQKGCEVLWHLSSNDELKMSIEKAGGIAAIVQAMHDYRSVAEDWVLRSLRMFPE
jgi:hypothetical protein